MSNSLNDGLSKPDQFEDAGIGTTEIGSSAVLTVNLSGGQVTTAKIANAAITSTLLGSVAVLTKNISGGQVTNAELGTNAVSGTKVSLEYGNIGIGSPLVYGNSVLAGNGNTGAGSSVAVTFGKAFLAAPEVTVGNTKSAEAIFVSGTATTGFTAQSATASQTFSWIAVGSGRI